MVRDLRIEKASGNAGFFCWLAMRLLLRRSLLNSGSSNAGSCSVVTGCALSQPQYTEYDAAERAVVASYGREQLRVVQNDILVSGNAASQWQILRVSGCVHFYKHTSIFYTFVQLANVVGGENECATLAVKRTFGKHTLNLEFLPSRIARFLIRGERWISQRSTSRAWFDSA